MTSARSSRSRMHGPTRHGVGYGSGTQPAATSRRPMATDKDGALDSPVTHDQSTVPIADAMESYLAQDRVAFSIPAHSGGRSVQPEFARWTGPDTARYDLPLG